MVTVRNATRGATKLGQGTDQAGYFFIGENMRVDSRDFNKLQKEVDPIVKDGKEDLHSYINEATSPIAETIEVIMRNTLEDVFQEIKEWFMDTYDMTQSDFDHFPTLDELLFHQNGWSLRSAIERHIADYNHHRSKPVLQAKLDIILRNEADRLKFTVYDSANERSGQFQWVTIGGANACGGCGEYYGTFKSESGSYILPPYHVDCACWAVWHD